MEDTGTLEPHFCVRISWKRQANLLFAPFHKTDLGSRILVIILNKVDCVGCFFSDEHTVRKILIVPLFNCTENHSLHHIVYCWVELIRDCPLGPQTSLPIATLHHCTIYDAILHAQLIPIRQLQ